MEFNRDMYGYNGQKLEYRLFVAGPFCDEDERALMLELIDLFRSVVAKMPIVPIVRGITKAAQMPAEMLRD